MISCITRLCKPFSFCYSKSHNNVAVERFEPSPAQRSNGFGIEQSNPIRTQELQTKRSRQFEPAPALSRSVTPVSSAEEKEVEASVPVRVDSFDRSIVVEAQV